MERPRRQDGEGEWSGLMSDVGGGCTMWSSQIPKSHDNQDYDRRATEGVFEMEGGGGRRLQIKL